MEQAGAALFGRYNGGLAVKPAVGGFRDDGQRYGVAGGAGTSGGGGGAAGGAGTAGGGGAGGGSAGAAGGGSRKVRAGGAAGGGEDAGAGGAAEDRLGGRLGCRGARQEARLAWQTPWLQTRRSWRRSFDLNVLYLQALAWIAAIPGTSRRSDEGPSTAPSLEA